MEKGADKLNRLKYQSYTLNDNNDTIKNSEEKSLENIILQMIRSNAEITKTELANATEASIATSKRMMKKLTEHGINQRNRSKKAGVWTITK